MDAQVNPDMIARLDELETRVRALVARAFRTIRRPVSTLRGGERQTIASAEFLHEQPRLQVD